jgi:serine/threonine protein kinase
LPNLIVERGREKGTSFELKAEVPCIAGRDPASVQIVISDPAASRRHFQVAAKDGRWFLTDLGSRNATYLNEEKVDKERELSSGDRIQVGETVLSYLDEDKTDKAASQGLNGKEIGGYLILERIGRGGMGTVFKAKQKSLNRVVALKVLASKFAKDPKFVDRFTSEARAAGQLNHPNVVQVLEISQSGGLHYFSMEFMEGGCVQDLLSAAPEGRLPWQEAMPLILDAARGLVFAEKRGIIHRDIKPDNLMLTSEQRVKIGDLGLAKKAEDGDGDKQIFGTPHFIAPEQAQGKEVTHAADLYALGATFYRIVTGKTPFSGETVKEILKKQINEPHQPILQVVPDFPPDLAAIVDKLMAKKVENRYQSATKLVEDLEAFQLEHQIELSGARKINKPLVIGLVVVALGAVGVGLHYALKPPEVVEKRTTVTEVDEAARQAAKEAAARASAAQSQLDESKAQQALLQIQVEDAKLGNITLDDQAKFEKVAAQYEEMAAKYSDPRIAATVKPAIDRAKEIRGTLQQMKAKKEGDEAAANGWWSTCKSKLAELESQKNWSEAIRSADKWRKDPAVAGHMAIVKEAREELAKVEAKEVDLAEKDLDDTKSAAKTAIDGGGDVEGALSSVQKWADALDQGKPDNEKLKGFVQDARLWVTDTRGQFATTLVQELDQDKAVYTDAVRALRQGGSGAGPVFDFQFEAAAAQLQTATAGLKSYAYQNRAATRIAHLREAQKAWSDWIQLLGEGKIMSAGEDLRGLPGEAKERTYKLNLETKPTLERFTVDAVVTGGTSKRTFAWADFTREELVATFLTAKLDAKLPGDVALGLAWMFVELQDDDTATRLLTRATGAGVKIAPDEETALRREITAIGSYDDLRKKAAAGGDPNEIVAAVAKWRQDSAGTETYVALDGRPGKDLQVLTNDQIDDFVNHLGKKPK